MVFGGGRPHRWRRESPGLTTVRLGLTAAGLILWGYGAHADVEWLRWVGIGVFAVVVALQFWPRPSDDSSDAESDQRGDER